MRVAICFSGQLRNVKSTFDRWYKQNVLDANSHHQIDVFVHSWFDKDSVGTVYYASNEIPNSVRGSEAVPNNIIQQVYDCYNPITFQLQHQKTFDEKNYNDRRLHGAVPQNGISRLYSLHQSVKLKLDYELENSFKYDVVACTRFDFIFKQPVVFDMINEDAVYHPGYSPHVFNVCYAMGRSHIIDTYAELYDNIDTVFNTGIDWCDENLASKYLKMCEIPTIDFRILNGLNRGD